MKTPDDYTSPSWLEGTRAKARLLTTQISSLREYMKEIDGDEQLFESLASPLFNQLESLYSDEFPLAQALDSSDLLLRIEGPGISETAPRASIVASQLNKARSQVIKVVKAISGVAEKHMARPDDIDLGVATLAHGSLILGFVAVPPAETGEKHGSLLGENDPLFKATKRAIREIGVVTRFVGDKEFRDKVTKEIPNARVRDAAIIAVEEFSPTSQSGISSVSISGKEFVGSPRPLTKDDRTYLRRIVRKPVSASRTTETFVGTVREVDLDAHRCELRQIRGYPNVSLRCAFEEALQPESERWLNKRMEFSGLVEKSLDGTPTLLMLQRHKKM